MVNIYGEYMNGKYLKLKAEFKNYLAIIEEDLPDIGFYLYVWQDGVGLIDYNQDSIEICKEVAFEEFGIPMDIWKEVDE